MSKLSPQMYAEALEKAYEALPESRRGVLPKRLFTAIDKNGDRSRADRIIREVERLVTRKSGGREVRLEFARHVSVGLINDLKKQFRVSDHIEVAINQKLIAGARVVIDDEQELDNSMARKLKDMFQKRI